MRCNAGLTALAVLLLSAAMAGYAQADSITFVFDHYVLPPHVGLQPPVPGGNYGTLTISDSAIDPNRVDITLTAVPLPAYGGGALEKFYINFQTPFLTNHQFYLVPVGAAPGVASNTPYSPLLGSTGYTNGVTQFLFADFIFDVTLDPTSTSLSFSGSLGFYNKLPNPDQPVNLDVSMFDLVSGGTNSPPMYAGYRLHNFNPTAPNYPDGEFFAFASSKQTAAPEPAFLLLLGTGLIGAALSRRRKARNG